MLGWHAAPLPGPGRHDSPSLVQLKTHHRALKQVCRDITRHAAMFHLWIVPSTPEEDHKAWLSLGFLATKLAQLGTFQSKEGNV